MPTPQPINDRATPRWPLRSVACAVLSGGEWYAMTVADISLGGAKLRGDWDHTQPITSVSLADAGPAITGDLLILEADSVWVDPAHTTVALRFDIPDRAAAARMLRFVGAHVAALDCPRV